MTFREKVKNASMSLTGNVLAVPLQFLGSIIAARILGPAAFGTYAFSMEYGAIFASFSDAGLGVLANRELPRHPDRQGAYMGSLLSLKLWAAAGAYVLLIAAAGLWGVDPSEFAAIAIVGAGSILFLFLPFINGALRARNRMDLEGILTFLQPLAYCLFLGGLFLLPGLDTGLILVSFCLLGSFVLTVLSGFWLIARDTPRPWLTDMHLVRGLAREAFPLGLAFVLTAVYVREVYFILKIFEPPETIGYFSIAFRLTFNTTTLAVVIAGAWMTGLSLSFQRDRNEFIRQTTLLMAVLTGTAVFVTLAGMLLGPPLVTLLFGQAYQPAIAPFRVLFCSLLFFCPNCGLKAAFECAGLQKLWTIVTAMGAALNLALCFLLIPRLGIMGASWSLLLTAVIMNAAAWWLLLSRVIRPSEFRAALISRH